MSNLDHLAIQKDGATLENSVGYYSEDENCLFVYDRLHSLAREKIDQYIDLGIDTKLQDADRTAALLRGSMSVAEALSQRDEDRRQEESRRREILGPEGEAFFESIGDGMRNDAAKRLVGAIQQNMGGEPLSQEQSDRLQGLIKTAVSAASLDNTDLFRPPAEWTQIVSDHQQNMVRGAAEFLTPAQMETLKGLVALDLAQRQEQRARQCKALGIKNGPQN